MTIKKSQRKARRRQARLWEDTVVMAIRDHQWRSFINSYPETRVVTDLEASDTDHPVRLGHSPSGMFKLDGRAESNLGDVALRAGERLFLIEVKPTSAEVRDEWWKNGKFKSKKLYDSLSKLTAKVASDPARIVATNSEQPEVNLIRYSLRGHMMAYWDPHEETDDGVNRWISGSIVSVPYIMSVAASVARQDSRNSKIIRDIPFQAFVEDISEPNAGWLVPPIEVLWDEGVRLFLKSSGAKSAMPIGLLGLDLDEMRTYIAWLTRSNEDQGVSEPVNAIVMSTLGSFFQWCGTTSGLAQVLSHVFEPPDTDPQVRRSWRRKKI